MPVRSWNNGSTVVTRARVRSAALTNPVPPTGPMYRLEKQTQPNVSVDLESTLENQNTLEFCLVRENSESTHQLHHCYTYRCTLLSDECVCVHVFINVVHVLVRRCD